MDYLFSNYNPDQQPDEAGQDFDPLVEILGGTPVLAEVFDMENFENLTPEEQELARINPCYLMDV